MPNKEKMEEGSDEFNQWSSERWISWGGFKPPFYGAYHSIYKQNGKKRKKNSIPVQVVKKKNMLESDKRDICHPNCDKKLPIQI